MSFSIESNRNKSPNFNNCEFYDFLHSVLHEQYNEKCKGENFPIVIQGDRRKSCGCVHHSFAPSHFLCGAESEAKSAGTP